MRSTVNVAAGCVLAAPPLDPQFAIPPTGGFRLWAVACEVLVSPIVPNEHESLTPRLKERERIATNAPLCMAVGALHAPDELAGMRGASRNARRNLPLLTDNRRMAEAPAHRCRVYGAPLAGVHTTEIDSSYHFGKHWHATYGLGLLEAGAQHSASGRGPVDAYAGDLITTNPGEVHDGRPLGVPSRRWRIVYLESRAMRSLMDLQSTDPDPRITQPVIRDAALRSALRRVLGHLSAGKPDVAASLACEESLVQALALLHRHTTAPLASAATPSNFSRLRDRLADAPLDAPSLDELAQLAQLSKFQVLRGFRKTYGVTPHAWLLQHRAERARGLIRSGLDLAAAAAASGFADQSHMTRVFVRQFGFTPGAWRQAVLPSRVQ